jgi:hypothetical protein
MASIGKIFGLKLHIRGGLTDTSFLKNHSQQNNFVHNYQGRGHTSFLVMVFNTTFNNISAISWQFN